MASAISSDKIDLLIYGPTKPLVEQGFNDRYALHVFETLSALNLLPDETGKPVSHPQVPHFFKEMKRGHYVSRDRALY